MSCAFPLTPKPPPWPRTTVTPILSELWGQVSFGPVPMGSKCTGWMLWWKFPGGKHTCMRIRDRLEAKVLAGDAEKLALTSQLSLGDIWLILGAHRLPSSASSSRAKCPCCFSPLQKSRLGLSVPLSREWPQSCASFGMTHWWTHLSPRPALSSQQKSQIHQHPNQSGGGWTATLLFCKKLWHFVSVCV